jgi:tripartite-type tricarboxylate transporter receptor subunit TctC
VLAPAGTPAGIIDRLNAAANEGLATADMQATLRKLGATPKSDTARNFAAFLAAEAGKWAAVAQAANIKVE